MWLSLQSCYQTSFIDSPDLWILVTHHWQTDTRKHPVLSMRTNFVKNCINLSNNMIYFTAKYGSLFKFNVYGTAESQLLVIRGLCVECQRDYVQTRQNESKLKMTPLNPFPCLTFTCVPTFTLHCHADFQRHCSKVHSVKLPTSLPATSRFIHIGTRSLPVQSRCRNKQKRNTENGDFNILSFSSATL